MPVSINKSTDIGVFFRKIEKKYLFLFDWDDTLYPRTFLSKNGYYPSKKEIPINVLNKLKLLEGIILDMFQNISLFGNVVIISNSDRDWINITCKLFMPSLFVFIRKNVLYLSAKNLYDTSYPGEPILWKAQTMKHVLKKFYGEEKNKYVISVGDSIIEYTAIKSVSKLLDIHSVTTVKFIEILSLNQLRSQLLQLKDDIDKHHTKMSVNCKIPNKFKRTDTNRSSKN